MTPKSEKRLVGYARVSTDEQTTALQLDALRPQAAAQFTKIPLPVLRDRGRALSARSRISSLGDTLVVWRLDRLGRSLRDLLDIWKMLRERDVALRSLTDHIDPGTAAGRMLYAVLGGVAQFERDVLRERTVAGMRAAERRGEHIGRPSALTPGAGPRRRRRCSTAVRVRSSSRVLRVGRSTLYRHLA